MKSSKNPTANSAQADQAAISKLLFKKIPKALDKVKELSGYTYTINEKESAGVIAQEVLKILPETISTRDDGYYAVSYHGLIGLLIEAVKELSEKVK